MPIDPLSLAAWCLDHAWLADHESRPIADDIAIIDDQPDDDTPQPDPPAED